MATAPVLKRKQVGAEVVEITSKKPVQDYGKEFFQRTVLLKIGFGLPGFQKRVKKGSREIKVTSGDEALYKTQKVILDSPEFEAVKKLDNAFRLWLYANFTLFSLGVFIVPTGMVNLVEAKVEEFLVERKKLIKEFAKAYPERVKEIKPRLGKGFNQNDYPPVQIVLEKFFFSYNYVTFEAPGQLKGINPDILAREQKKAEKLFQDAAGEYKNALRISFAEMVKNLQNKLTDEFDAKTGVPKQKRLHDTTVVKLQEWLNTFDLRDAMNDTELKTQVENVRKLINDISPEALKSTDTLRESVRKGMEQVTAKLETMVEDAPIRKFKFADMN